MDYQGPAAANYANVRSLNRTFLGMLRASGCGAAQRRALPEKIRPQIVGLTDLHIERLSRCPFLLLSLRERDADYWQQALSSKPTGDLWADSIASVEERIVTAGLAFLWQLARRNPYAVRLIAGAGVPWCERLADVELLDLLQSAGSRGDLLSPRFAGQVEPWSKLLGPGIASRPVVRAAAQLSVLQLSPSKQVMKASGVQPEQAVFLDDRADFVAGAQVLGIHGYQFRSFAQVRADMKGLGFAKKELY